MYIKRLTATFGRLENETLELGPGLNIIQAPNEGGKSTWTAFLRVMLYGLNTRDRSAAADKRRYLPWSGSPMQGSMDLTCSRGDVTVTRRTARANSPMGGFSAVYTGTNNAVERLTAADCGEALTGVPLEVFERSAYIRQSGIAVDQSAALERRIAALITTGEEDTSFSDAYEKLKKQLNRRRYNKNGILPQLEQEIAQLRQTQQETDALRRQLMQTKEREPELEKLLQETRSQIRQHELCDMAQRAAEAVAAKKAYDEAGAKQEELAEALTHLQPKAVWEDALTKIAAYRASCKDADNFGKIVFDSETHLQRARDALAAHPLGRYTPAQAEQLPLEEKPRPKSLPLWFPLTALVCAAAAAFAMIQNGVFLYVALGSCLGAWGAIMLALALPRQKAQKAWDTQHEALLGARRSQLEEYYIIYDEVQAAQAELQVAGSARDNARAALAQRQAELLALTGTADADGAERAAREALALYRRAEDAAEAAHRERARWETAAKLAPEMPEEIPRRPHTDPDTLRRREEGAAAELAVLRRSIHTDTGKLQALGDPVLTDTRLQQLEERRDTAQREYDAIALAMETLQDANSRMQNRFSPALGEKSANFFTKLTMGKYNRVLLDREMNPSAQETGQIIPRETTLLSQGAADQLYLAVRLAICEMVLPEEDPAPILLDDALVTFDDERCAAALQVLTELAKKRQILLFTCQSREAELLKDSTQHRIITL